MPRGGPGNGCKKPAEFRFRRFFQWKADFRSPAPQGKHIQSALHQVRLPGGGGFLPARKRHGFQRRLLRLPGGAARPPGGGGFLPARKRHGCQRRLFRLPGGAVRPPGGGGFPPDPAGLRSQRRRRGCWRLRRWRCAEARAPRRSSARLPEWRP